LQILINVLGLGEPLVGDGETIIVNRHGALIISTVPLRVGMRIAVLVVSTSKRGDAKVVYVDPERPRVCGIALDKPENIWGVSVPPDDWQEDGSEA